MQPMSELEAESLRDYYRKFAHFEAAGTSAIYADWALGVSQDEDILSRLFALPAPKRQANLLFAAARHLGAPEKRYEVFRDWLLRNWESTRELMMERSTQTNEAGRCAVLLPALARIESPVWLIEVGASAGLCLYPDRYSYAYSTPAGMTRLHPADDPSTVEIPCSLMNTAVPDRLPEVAGRTGVDLNPLDITDPDQLKWLDSLVWPEHHDRRERLARAARIAATDPPRLARGDLLSSIETLIDEADPDAQIVVFHSAVLVYVDVAERKEFAARMRAREDIIWISNEGRAVFPEIGDQVGKNADGRFVLAVNGEAIALTDPHGRSYEGL